jgi:hypothetical protein
MLSWRAGQMVEALEPRTLLSVTCPTISGFVFLDENSSDPALSNNGLFDPGEAPIASASVQLIGANQQVVATTSTDSTGAYSFGGMDPNAPPATPATISQTITLGNPASPNLATNFTNLSFAPALNLFDSSLGTLQSVQISSDVLYNSAITVANLSQGSPATGISANISGSYQINGLGPTLTIAGDPSKTGTGADLPPISGSGGAATSESIGLTATDDQSPALSSAQGLAFFTAQSGGATITPTMTALGSGVGSASNGNVRITQSTFAAATLTVTYTYLPEAPCLIEPGTYTIVQNPEVAGVINGKESQQGTVLAPNGPPQTLTVTIQNETTNSTNNDFAKLLAPTPGPTPTTPQTTSIGTPSSTAQAFIAPPTPTPSRLISPETIPPLARVTNVTRFGVHHQPTKLAVQFGGAVIPAQAASPSNYNILLRGADGVFGTADDVAVPIVAAVYNASRNTVLLTSSRRLNLHDHFMLKVNSSAISVASDPGDTLVPFGGKQDLGGFVGNHGVGTRLIPIRPNNDHVGTDAAPLAALGTLAAPAPRIAIPVPNVHLATVGGTARRNSAPRRHH